MQKKHLQRKARPRLASNNNFCEEIDGGVTPNYSISSL
jgi:hypothetical protein